MHANQIEIHVLGCMKNATNYLPLVGLSSLPLKGWGNTTFLDLYLFLLDIILPLFLSGVVSFLGYLDLSKRQWVQEWPILPQRCHLGTNIEKSCLLRGYEPLSSYFKGIQTIFHCSTILGPNDTKAPFRLTNILELELGAKKPCKEVNILKARWDRIKTSFVDVWILERKHFYQKYFHTCTQRVFENSRKDQI